MKLTFIALVAVVALFTPILSFACPPPPAPGYDGGDPATGPRPGTEYGGVPVNPGAGTGEGTTSDGSTPEPGTAPGTGADVGTGEECM